MIGGYLTPPALSTGEDHPWILFGYVFLLNAGGPAAGAKAAMEGTRADRRRRDHSPLRSLVRPMVWRRQSSRGHRFCVRLLRAIQRRHACPSCGRYFSWPPASLLALIWRDHSSFCLVESRHRRRRTRCATDAPGPRRPSGRWPASGFRSGSGTVPDAPFAAISAAFLIFFAWALWRKAESPPDWR